MEGRLSLLSMPAPLIVRLKKPRGRYRKSLRARKFQIVLAVLRRMG